MAEIFEEHRAAFKAGLECGVQQRPFGFEQDALCGLDPCSAQEGSRCGVQVQAKEMVQPGDAERASGGQLPDGTAEEQYQYAFGLLRQANYGEAELALTVTEFRILAALLRNPGHVKSRAQLLEEGYPDDTYVSERTIDSHIKRLRRKFEQLAPGVELIETVYGLGYRYGRK